VALQVAVGPVVADDLEGVGRRLERASGALAAVGPPPPPPPPKPPPLLSTKKIVIANEVKQSIRRLCYFPNNIKMFFKGNLFIRFA
jgi:hypothetical protein